MATTISSGILLLGIKGSEPEKRLIRNLFQNSGYDPAIRPVEHVWEAVNVSLMLRLYQLIEIVSTLYLIPF